MAIKTSDQKVNILSVEDDATIAELIRRGTGSLGHTCVTAGSIEEARQVLYKSTFELILLDINLPDGSGMKLIDDIQALNPGAAIVMVTGVGDKPTALTSFKKGAYAYLLKPFTLEDLAIQVEGALYRRKLELENRGYEEGLEELIDERTKELVGALREIEEHYDSTIRALSTAAEARLPGGQEHLRRVAQSATLIGKALELERNALRNLERCALLHDIGMVGIPDKILLKPGPLDEEEWASVRKHPEIGYRIISKVNFLKDAAETVRQHHERYDGKGYPMGLKGEQILLPARIISVADTFDAMIRKQPFREPLSFREAKENITLLAGNQLDPKAVEAFLSVEKKLEAEVYRKV